MLYKCELSVGVHSEVRTSVSCLLVYIVLYKCGLNRMLVC